MEGETTNAMTELLTMLTGAASSILGQIGTIGSTIVDTPVLALGLGFFFVGGVIGIFGRLLSRN